MSRTKVSNGIGAFMALRCRSNFSAIASSYC
jgi:hypothetical protein